MKCAVCEQEAPCYEVSSTCSNKIYPYCVACIRNGYEVYDELVKYGFTYDTFTPKFRSMVVTPTLQYYNKTVEQFNADVIRERGEKDEN